ncbi:DUF998 domain-containing protein [Streptomyces sp. NPDC016845]|uniref:DUF998 domain-containing protein n=1 Tax=Streptomyces sp. NPDC016845 TaxID=3364972 RepID=UPI0037B8AFDD
MLLMCSGVLYNAWLVQSVLVTGVDPVHTFVSELLAEGQPYGSLFRAIDLLAGGCAAAAAVLALDARLPRGRWETAGWWAFGVFGAATMVDSRSPLTCALVADRACFAREVAGLAPVSHTVHATTSAVSTAAALAAMTAFTVASRRCDRSTAVHIDRSAQGLVLVQWAVNVWLMVAVIVLMTRSVNLWVGLAERSQELLLAGWTLLSAAGLIPAERPPLTARPQAARRRVS